MKASAVTLKTINLHFRSAFNRITFKMEKKVHVEGGGEDWLREVMNPIKVINQGIILKKDFRLCCPSFSSLTDQEVAFGWRKIANVHDSRLYLGSVDCHSPA